ncbi:MAG: hypothetical protein ACTFAK_01240 [Candidatus Electronema sp. VV]
MENINPLQHAFIEAILEKERVQLFQLLEAFGSAIHILLPEVFKENIELYNSIFEKYNLDYQILFAAKANKGKSFLEICSQMSSGVDVSSIFELRSALSHGITGRNIGISGPIKTDQFLLLALKCNSLISLDSLDELAVLVNFIKKGLVNEKIRLLIRIGELQKKKSRFGIQKEQLRVVYKILHEYIDFFDFQGFSFHLDGYLIKERVNAIFEIYKEIEKARELGFYCNIIDIGGGFTIQYLEKDVWELFKAQNAQERKNFFGEKHLDSFYPYYSEYSKKKFLEAILNSHVQSSNALIYEILKSNEIQLIIEPGRSLLDQAGFTLMKVRGNRTTEENNLIIVDANFNHLSEQWFNTDFIPGPIHIPRGNTQTQGQTYIASVAGNTCMESDILTWRKISFSQKPEKGDLLAYVNTAGYQMDSNESTFHQIPIPEKITMIRGKGNTVRWKRDEEFSQLDLL